MMVTRGDVTSEGSEPGSTRKIVRCRSEDQQLARSEKILDAALEVFSTKGFFQADVQEIADRVGVGKGTIYRQFGNKEGLFLATTRHAQAWLRCEVDKAAEQGGTALGQLRAGMHAFVDFFDQHPGVVELLIQERAHFRGQHAPTFFESDPQHHAKWTRIFEQLVAEGILRDLPTAQLERALTNFVFGTMFVSYIAGRERALSDDSDATFDILFRGLLTPAAAKQLGLASQSDT